MILLCFFLGFIEEVYNGQSNANKQDEQRSYQHSQLHGVEHEQDYIHSSEHQTRQIRYTGDQLYKFDRNFYITKFNYTTVNIIKE